MKYLYSSLAALALALSSAATAADTTKTTKTTKTTTLTADASKPGGVMGRHIFGHFDEHFGHGSYEGVQGVPTSLIPGARGSRNDITNRRLALIVAPQSVAVLGFQQ
ncbi:hypothetical protein [Undibacterium sp. Ji49W]|uniref:hypothetical protein n=1 Tax=Undibacterium sp. Ji49W TaxID=3413040 RepID=UPI003BF1370E